MGQEGMLPLLTLPMLRLLSFEAQEYFWKLSKPCHVGINWIALAKYSRMSTHLPGFQSYFRIFESFCIGQISHQQHKGNPSNDEASFGRIDVHTYIWKPSQTCHVGIHWIAHTEYSQMSMCQGFSHFFRFFASFCIGKTIRQQHKG